MRQAIDTGVLLRVVDKHIIVISSQGPAALEGGMMDLEAEMTCPIQISVESRDMPVWEMRYLKVWTGLLYSRRLSHLLKTV